MDKKEIRELLVQDLQPSVRSMKSMLGDAFVVKFNRLVADLLPLLEDAPPDPEPVADVEAAPKTKRTRDA